MASFDSQSVGSRARNENVNLILKNVDAVAHDAFLITTHRKERYESPPSSRACTPAAAAADRPASGGTALGANGDSNLLTYFERMKTPLGNDGNQNHAPADQASLDGRNISTPQDASKKRWSKLRTAVALSAALDPDRALKQYEVSHKIKDTFSDLFMFLYSELFGWNQKIASIWKASERWLRRQSEFDIKCSELIHIYF